MVVVVVMDWWWWWWWCGFETFRRRRLFRISATSFVWNFRYLARDVPDGRIIIPYLLNKTRGQRRALFSSPGDEGKGTKIGDGRRRRLVVDGGNGRRRHPISCCCCCCCTFFYKHKVHKHTQPQIRKILSTLHC